MRIYFLLLINVCLASLSNSQNNELTLTVDNEIIDRSIGRAPASYSFGLKKATPAW